MSLALLREYCSNGAAGGDDDDAPVEDLPPPALRMFPCKPVASGRFEELRIAMSSPRHLLVSASQIVYVEESRNPTKRGSANILSARGLTELSKLHFKPSGKVLSLVFKGADDIANGTEPVGKIGPNTLQLDLGSPELAAA